MNNDKCFKNKVISFLKFILQTVYCSQKKKIRLAEGKSLNILDAIDY